MDSLYRLTAISFGVGVTLHNLEEAAYLPRWFRSNLKLLFEPNHKIYWILTSLVSVVVWVPIFGVCIAPENRRLQTVVSGFALLMVINVVVPHLALTVFKRSYSPGTGTAVLFNLPLGVLLMREQLIATTAPAQMWREAFYWALLLAVGTLGCLYGAHAILAARERRSTGRGKANGRLG